MCRSSNDFGLFFYNQAIWATQHDVETLVRHCELALVAVLGTSLTGDALCTGTKASQEQTRCGWVRFDFDDVTHERDREREREDESWP